MPASAGFGQSLDKFGRTRAECVRLLAATERLNAALQRVAVAKARLSETEFRANLAATKSQKESPRWVGTALIDCSALFFFYSFYFFLPLFWFRSLRIVFVIATSNCTSRRFYWYCIWCDY